MRIKLVTVIILGGCGLFLGSFLIRYYERLVFMHALSARVAECADHEREFVNIAALTPFRWDTVYVFPPYSSSEMIQKALGGSWWFVNWCEIQKSEGHFLIVFTRNHRVVQHCMYERRYGDFVGMSYTSAISIHNAVFVSKRQAGSKQGAEYIDVMPLKCSCEAGSVSSSQFTNKVSEDDSGGGQRGSQRATNEMRR